MNPAILCIEDTLRLLLEEAKQAKETAAAKRGTPEEGFEVGRSEALAEALHTWGNQLQTFGLDAELDGIWEELRSFLTTCGYWQQSGGRASRVEPSAVADRPRD